MVRESLHPARNREAELLGRADSCQGPRNGSNQLGIWVGLGRIFRNISGFLGMSRYGPGRPRDYYFGYWGEGILGGEGVLRWGYYMAWASEWLLRVDLFAKLRAGQQHQVEV